MNDRGPSTGDLSPLRGLFRVDQVAWVVRDLDRALEIYAREPGAGPWSVWTFGPGVLRTMKIRGRDAVFSMRLAISGQNPMLELIQPLTGDTAYQEFLATSGEGVHHVATFVKDLAGGRQQLERHGVECIMEGWGQGQDGSGGFAYFDTRERMGVILELLMLPNQRRPPERVVEG